MALKCPHCSSDQIPIEIWNDNYQHSTQNLRSCDIERREPQVSLYQRQQYCQNLVVRCSKLVFKIPKNMHMHTSKEAAIPYRYYIQTQSWAVTKQGGVG